MSKAKFFLISGLLILGLAGYGYFKAIPGTGELGEDLPKIEITPKFFDFGEAEHGDVLEYNFKVKNLGEKILEIKRVATSCSCTSGKVDKEMLETGQEAKLIVTYDTGAMSGPHGQGQQERIIFVQSNDPINPQVEVIIYANVR